MGARAVSNHGIAKHPHDPNTLGVALNEWSAVVSQLPQTHGQYMIRWMLVRGALVARACLLGATFMPVVNATIGLNSVVLWQY